MKQITKFNFSKLLTLAVFVLVLFGSGQRAKAEVPNGDGDLLWERGLNGRTVNDAVFHPINGNIIAAVNHEIWEIDPKDGHTIRVFEGGYPGNEADQFKKLRISSDGNTVVTGGGNGLRGIILWDYNSGKVKHIFYNNQIFDGYDNIGIFPDNNKIIFTTYKNNYGSDNNVMYINIYDIQKDSILRNKLINNTYCDRFELSKDGKYVAFGFSKGTPQNGWTHTMELWDAETLTPIRSFGSPGNISEFRDVQISNDDQYVGFRGENYLYLFNINGQSMVIQEMKSCFGFTFSNDSKKIIMDILYWTGNYSIDIYNLENLQPVYRYSGYPTIIRSNSDNEIFTDKMSLYSNHWYTVGVNEPAGTDVKIEQVNYTKNNLQIITNGIDIINDLIITDTLGKRIYQQNNITITNNQAEIPLSLPSGNYLIKLTANGKELTGKFIVVN